MIRKYLLSLITILLIFSIESCEYPLNEEYTSPIKPTDPATLEVKLNPEQLSYVITGITEFTCEAITKGLKIYGIKVYVDSVELNTNGNNTPSFIINCRRYSEGAHTLTVFISTNSNSGSIADIAGLEGFVLAGSWELIVDKSPPTSVEITRIYNDDGILKIEWGKYSKHNFYKYLIYRTLHHLPGDSPQTELIGMVDDSLHTYCYDSSYVGGLADYCVVVVTPIDLRASSESKLFSDPAPDFKVEWVGEDIMKLSWKKCNYPKAFGQYRITLDYDTVINIANINTNSVTGHYAVIGEERNFQLEVLPTNKYQFTGILTSRIKKGVGYPFLKYTQLLKNNINTNLIITNPEKIYRFEPLSGKFVDSIPHPYPKRVGINYILSPANDVLLFPDMPALSIDPLTFKVDTLPFESFFSKNLSNTSYGLTNGPVGYGLYDFKKRNVVCTLSLASYKDRFISGDNKYLFEYDDFLDQLKCYQINNGQLAPIWTTPAVSYYFLPENPGIVLVITETEFKVINIALNQSVLSIPVKAWTSILDVDKVSKIVMLYNTLDEKLYLYNYETGEKVRTFDAALNLFTNYRLSNNTLYATSGFRIPLSLKKK